MTFIVHCSRLDDKYDSKYFKVILGAKNDIAQTKAAQSMFPLSRSLISSKHLSRLDLVKDSNVLSDDIAFSYIFLFDLFHMIEHQYYISH